MGKQRVFKKHFIMPVDLVLFDKEKGGDPDIVRESQRRRYDSVELVDEIIELNEKRKSDLYRVQEVKTEMNKLNKENGNLRMQSKKLQKEIEKEKTDEKEKQFKEFQEKIAELKANAEKFNEVAKATEEELNTKLGLIGNIVHENTPVSDTEEKNRVERHVLKEQERKADNLLHHHEVLHRLYLAELDRGVGIAGHRAYFLRGAGVRLNQALISYGEDFLSKYQYTELQTPFFMRCDVMSKTCQLGTDGDELYKLANEDAYLIATSEQPISALHQNEWLREAELPIRYAGVSTCFRKEAGAHGKDVWGIFRVHQFEKVEQFVICEPEKSEEELERMLKIAEEFYQSLKLPYRVVSIVSKALNAAAAQKYDLEAWFPARQDYRELVSASNCTDYQSRALEIRCGVSKKDQVKKYVHMLNGTLVATERTMCCILENYQDENGIVIPEVLRPYMGGKERLDYVRELPKSGKNKKAAKQQNPNASKKGGDKK